MPTPSIQTLTTDAQQVLNLDSISAVRSVVAVALANANTGTPLNPNLTTQQLWDQFYQVVTRPKSDIESIIANQLMKFLYSPPAPGGAGADKQVIFNDGGVLAGDADFLWNKTTNLLTVTGSATITGDLTVDTNVLKVDSANNRVGIVKTTPAYPLDVGGRISYSGAIGEGADTTVSSIGTSLLFGNAAGWADCQFFAGGNSQYRIQSAGVFTWYDGAGGTRMTLNSTGLGVGAAPQSGAKLTIGSGSVAGYSDTIFLGGNSNNTAQFRILWNHVGAGYLGIGTANDAYGSLIFGQASGANGAVTTEWMRIDGSGNVGVGVTPSAWSGFKAIEFGSGNALMSSSSGYGQAYFLNNAYYNGSAYIYKNTQAAVMYQQNQGAHQWYNAPSGTAGNAISWTQAMTLDASGNLLVGDTAQSSNERLRVNNTASNGWAVTMTSTTRGWLNRQSDANGGIAAYFEVGSGNTNVGSINTTSSGTSFVTTSDYRLKEAVQPLVGGLARISALKPSIYKWKVDGSSGEGFLAHELAEVVPFAVTGEKDAVNEDGSIKPQGVDLSKVVPILVAAIQELTARVQTLETR